VGQRFRGPHVEAKYIVIMKMGGIVNRGDDGSFII
jgi:hypothetical protein